MKIISFFLCVMLLILILLETTQVKREVKNTVNKINCNMNVDGVFFMYYGDRPVIMF